MSVTQALPASMPGSETVPSMPPGPPPASAPQSPLVPPQSPVSAPRCRLASLPLPSRRLWKGQCSAEGTDGRESSAARRGAHPKTARMVRDGASVGVEGQSCGCGGAVGGAQVRVPSGFVCQKSKSAWMGEAKKAGACPQVRVPSDFVRQKPESAWISRRSPREPPRESIHFRRFGARERLLPA